MLLAQWDHAVWIHAATCDVGEHVMTQSFSLMLPMAALIYHTCMAVI